MKKSFFILLVLLVNCVNLYSQETPNEKLISDEHYLNYEKNYKKYISSDNYIEYQKITKLITEKLNGEKFTLNFSDGTDVNNWLEKNISKTRFKDIDDAKSTFEKALIYTEIDLRELEKLNKMKEILLKKYDKDTILKTLNYRLTKI